jgi:hypothetical protein
MNEKQRKEYKKKLDEGFNITTNDKKRAVGSNNVEDVTPE